MVLTYRRYYQKTFGNKRGIRTTEIHQLGMHVNCRQTILFTNWSNVINADVIVAAAKKTGQGKYRKLLHELNILFTKATLKLLEDFIKYCYKRFYFHALLRLISCQFTILSLLLSSFRGKFCRYPCAVAKSTESLDNICRWFSESARFRVCIDKIIRMLWSLSFSPVACVIVPLSYAGSDRCESKG